MVEPVPDCGTTNRPRLGNVHGPGPHSSAHPTRLGCRSAIPRPGRSLPSVDRSRSRHPAGAVASRCAAQPANGGRRAPQVGRILWGTQPRGDDTSIDPHRSKRILWSPPCGWRRASRPEEAALSRRQLLHTGPAPPAPSTRPPAHRGAHGKTSQHAGEGCPSDAVPRSEQEVQDHPRGDAAKQHGRVNGPAQLAELLVRRLRWRHIDQCAIFDLEVPPVAGVRGHPARRAAARVRGHAAAWESKRRPMRTTLVWLLTGVVGPRGYSRCSRGTNR